MAQHGLDLAVRVLAHLFDALGEREVLAVALHEALLGGGVVDGVVDALEGPDLAAVRVANDVHAIVEEVVVELGEILEVWVGLPFGVGIACLEGDGGLGLDLTYKNESRSDFRHFFLFLTTFVP